MQFFAKSRKKKGSAPTSSASNKQGKDKSGAKDDARGDDDDWELLDEDGECTNYTPDPAMMPYARLFAMSKERVKRSDFEALRTLGRGTSGIVLLVRYKKNHQLYAMKIINKSDVVSSGRAQDPIRERDVMRKTKSRFLVRMHYSFQSSTKLYFVLDYLPGGDLYYYTEQFDGGRLDEPTARFYAACIYSALQFLHESGIVYRDLKPENVLLDENGVARLADFGLSKQLMDYSDQLTDQKSSRAQSFVGTAFYIAPEMLRNKSYSFQVDWWSFGVLVFNLLTGENPFYGDNVKQIFAAILQKDFSIHPSYKISPEAQDLLNKLLAKDEATRIKGADIKTHPWFAGLDWDTLGTETAPNWVPPEEMITADKAAHLAGKTMAGDSFSLTRGGNIDSFQQKLFENFTLDNSDPL
ncbi:RAC family serine/threonine-protein kinase-like protein [Diplonema papillatum]|nr:RAC family serine/threonine-protein kinase-like protein [Diplonema papillatum]